MSSDLSGGLPGDYPRRIKSIRGLRGLTQTQFAELVGVSFASVNRWENGQSRPNSLAWRRVVELETLPADGEDQRSEAEGPSPSMDFSADPEAVSAVAEAHRLASGHLFNPAFATETSLIDPLPHQRIAVYQRMLDQSPLRFLLADDAGAGKTIMTGLYVREMLSRRLLRRVLVVPPAGLVGNWEREMRTLFRLPFRILGGADARAGNPFLGPESDLAIVSVDTLAGERMFGHLKDPQTNPYDLVVFDEAHKLSADRQPDFRVRKTGRYKLAEALAGAETDDKDGWGLSWSAQHLLLLTATPHMGKDHPYYYLWRLLLPDALSTFDAFEEFPPDSRQRHFIRRTKEEMVHFNRRPLYPQRKCDTLGYELSQGPGSEQELYDETTDYMRHHYNRAAALNRSAARLAMSVFQRRLASSTYALLRSFERRLEKLESLIDDIRSGRLTEEELARRQQRLRPEDLFETRTADEEAEIEDGEQHEDFEARALEGTVAVNLAELEAERVKVAGLLDKARRLFDAGEESKFEKLREVLAAPDYRGQKLIIFTEHRDTAGFLVRRLEGLGYTGRVALIHGGLTYPERERQVEMFRRPADQGGASYLVATDAAGEGINLQFCWLMVNYDIPWNPARLEQRMGRIHRYGQKRDPVVIVNLVSAGTREGRVLKTLLDKLEAIRRHLSSDKVFDVVGRLFEGLSVRDYLEQAVIDEGGAEVAARQLEGNLTEEQMRALEERERALYGDGGEVRGRLDDLNEELEQENYRRLLPGYVRRFVEHAAPLLHLRLDGDPGRAFSLVPDRPRAADPLLSALEVYPEGARQRLTVYKPESRDDAIWLHPGEPVFDSLSAAVRERLGVEGLRGAVFSDPYASDPYLFHIACVSVHQHTPPDDRREDRVAPQLAESRLVGMRQGSGGAVEECPVEHLLLLRGAGGIAPGGVPLATLARGMAGEAAEFLGGEVVEQIVQTHRQRRLTDLPGRLEFVNRGFDYQAAELAAARSRLRGRAGTGDHQAAEELAKVRERQRSLNALRARRLSVLRAEPEHIRAGEAEFLVHALVVPAQDDREAERYDADVEAIAMEVAAAYEKERGAQVRDVSKPELARRAGLQDWPGFDLRSLREGSEPRDIEVKGRAGTEGVEMSENEWAKACNLRDSYWLYVVFDCATPRPRLVRVRDPFARLLVRDRESRTFTIAAGAVMEAAEEGSPGS